MLEIRNIELVRGGQKLLADLSLNFEDQRLTVIVGPNGAGKSSLMRVLSGEWAPCRGDVLWNGRPIAAMGAAEMGRQRAFLHQETHLDFSFSVLEVVLLGRYPHGKGVETPRDLEIAREALRQVDLIGLQERDYTSLSGGEKQRVQLARSLVQVWDPQPGACYWLLDEPVNNLDPAHQRAALELLREWVRKGAMVVAVLHDLNLALEFADHLLLLNRGRLLASGRPADVFEPTNLQQAFGLDMELVWLPGRIHPIVVTAVPLDHKGEGRAIP